jgi:hypothetical protein
MSARAARSAGRLGGGRVFRSPLRIVAGWAGAAGIVSVAGIFLAWFYRGRRPDLEAGK